jgi:predicted component of type VI protein secretion system
MRYVVWHKPCNRPETSRSRHGPSIRMRNLLRKFLRPTLREQLEDGVREALRRYAERHTAPNLRVYVSTDLVEKGLDPALWARDEAEHLRRFALRWAEDNQVPRTGLRIDVILLDTKREFAFVKPVAVEPSEPAARPDSQRSAAPRAPTPLAEPPVKAGTASAILDVVESPSFDRPLSVSGEMTVGRKSDGAEVVGLGDRYMSSRHARFHLAGGKLYVTDLDSKNRTYINDRPLPPHEPVPVSVGDEIRVGSTRLRVSRVGG